MFSVYCYFLRHDMKKILLFTTLSVVLGLISACAQNLSPYTYEACEAGVANKVLAGVIVGKRPVKVDASSGVGGLAGTGIGAAGGSAIGNSSGGNIAGAIGGAVIGGVVGHALDKTINTKRAYEYIIDLRNGSTISIAQVQEMEFAVGQPVLIIYGAVTRIVPDDTIKPIKKLKK
jgi:outer membrane lipoprotein SlyB